MRVDREADQAFGLHHYWHALFRYFGLRRVLLWGIESVLNMILSPLPIIGGSLIRKLLFSPLLKSSGKGLLTAPGVKFLHAYNIEIGDRCSLSYGTMLNGRGGLRIGDDFTTGPDVIVLTVEHFYQDRDLKILEQGEYESPVRIGNDVWCGARAVILPGITIADGTVVAAGAVVTKDTEPYSVVAGVPAKVINHRQPGKKHNTEVGK
jgi:maltose O-acetyltransferase